MQGAIMPTGIRNHPLVIACLVLDILALVGMGWAFTHFGDYRVLGVRAYQPEPVFWYGIWGVFALGGVAWWAHVIRPLRWRDIAPPHEGTVEWDSHIWEIKRKEEHFLWLWRSTLLIIGMTAVLQILTLSRSGGWAHSWNATAFLANSILMSAVWYSNERYGKGTILNLANGKSKIRLFVRSE